MPKKVSKFPPKKPDSSYLIKPRLKLDWSPYQKAVFKNIAMDEGHLIIEAFAGASKCLGKGTSILCFDGKIKPVEDIKIGDILMGPNSEPKTVLSVGTGYGDLVKIVPIKGDPWICNTDHILTLKGTNIEKGKTIDISVHDFVEKYKSYKNIDKNWKLFKPSLISFKEQEVPYEPYLLGLWIGDGTSDAARLSNVEPEIIEYCQNIGPKYGYLVRSIYNKKHNYYDINFVIGGRGVGHRGTPHFLKRFFTQKCINENGKVIPDEYLINSEENRLQLLAGILDTDGSYPRKNAGYFQISSTNEKLANQYVFLARSLGFASYVKKRTTTIKSINFVGECWAVSIIGDVDKIPTKVARKKASPRLQIKNPLVNGFSIENIGKGDYYGFTLDGDGRFLLGDFTITHNTTTIVESFRYVPKGKKSIALAFNKKIQEELQSRAPSYIETFTFHSLGFRAIKQRFGNVELDDNKVFNLVKSQLDENTDYEIIINVCDTVAFCKYGLLDTPSQIDNIIDRFSIDLCGMDRKQFISLVIKTLSLDKSQTTKIDFNDMCWFPFVYNLPMGLYDYVYIDERQDLNKSQLVMAKKVCRPNGGRIIATGDENQALYSWRLADTSIIEEIKNQEKTKTLPLPISYRCPKKIIELAKNWVPDITCPDTAIEGEINEISTNEMYKLVKPGCFILSRTNAPLIKICMSLIKNGIKANIRGRDVGKQLNALIKKSKKKQIPAFLKWLEDWKNEEVARLKDKNLNPENVLDRCECLINLCEECSGLSEVSNKISELFDDSDENNIVILSTVHRAKGLERNDIFLLRWTFRVWFDQMNLFDKPNEECNIAYVGITRSKNRLFIVQKSVV